MSVPWLDHDGKPRLWVRREKSGKYSVCYGLKALVRHQTFAQARDIIKRFVTNDWRASFVPHSIDKIDRFQEDELRNLIDPNGENVIEADLMVRSALHYEDETA